MYLFSQFFHALWLFYKIHVILFLVSLWSIISAIRETDQNIICSPYPQDHYLRKNIKEKCVVLNGDHL